MEDQIIAIDFGTSYCRVGVWLDNKVNIIKNKKGKKEIPSFITFLDDKILVGDSSKIQAIKNPRRTFFQFKSLIDIQDYFLFKKFTKLRPYTVKYNSSQILFEYITYHKHEKVELKIEVLCALLFQKIKRRTNKFLKKEIKNVIITIPSKFNINQKKY